MRFSRHQLLALMLGAGMATALPAQGRAGGARGAGRQIDSTRLAKLQNRDTTQRAALRERLAAAATPAGLILQMRERLGLTDDQVNRLETLKAGYVEPSQTELVKLREELAAVSAGEVNLQAARSAMNKLNDATTNATLARLDERNKARAVLNADQQVQFDAMQARRPMLQPGMDMMGAGGRGVARGGEPKPGAARKGGRGGPPGTPPPVPPAGL
ncbi:MAG: hypothetical protein H7Z40_04515 [Phycisphaerae bacterium]|nr:hypothetical protein [Gemmatimonadaceae bacterium]